MLKAYRVSKNSGYSSGDLIWEASPGPNNHANMLWCQDLIRSKNQSAIDGFPQLPINQVTPAYEALKEAALEIVRTEEFSSLPSRFDTMMVFLDMDQAKGFLSKNRPSGFWLYEVGISIEIAFFTGDMNMIDAVNGRRIEDFLDMARRYWSGVLTESPIMESILAAGTSVKVLNKL